MQVGHDTTLARLMVESVKAAMPAFVVQMTDRESPRVIGADKVVREDRANVGFLENGVPCGLMTFRMQLLAKLDDAPTVVLDTDVWVQRDLSTVFDRDFDIALTKRTHAVKDPNGNDVAAEMPYNTGVMFSRSGQFWRDCLASVRAMPRDLRNWYGDQYAVRDVSKKYRLLELSTDPYNYSPRAESEDVTDKVVVHYKGLRKAWMINRALQINERSLV